MLEKVLYVYVYIHYTHLHILSSDLEWKLTYVGSAESDKYDQVLDSVMVGPVPVGVNRFVLEVSGLEGLILSYSIFFLHVLNLYYGEGVEQMEGRSSLCMEGYLFLIPPFPIG